MTTDYGLQVLLAYLKDGCSTSRKGFLNYFDIGYYEGISWRTVLSHRFPIANVRFKDYNVSDVVICDGRIIKNDIIVDTYADMNFFIRVYEDIDNNKIIAETPMSSAIQDYFRAHLATSVEIMLQWEIEFTEISTTTSDFARKLLLSYLKDGSEPTKGFVNYFDIGYYDSGWHSVLASIMPISIVNYVDPSTKDALLCKVELAPEDIIVNTYPNKDFFIKVFSKEDGNDFIGEMPMATILQAYFQTSLNSSTELIFAWEIQFENITPIVP